MSRNQISQQQRTQNNPLVLGTFNSTTVRRLHGKLGPKNQVIGRADTRYQSNGGFGNGTYNHWFQINVASPAWIIITKSGPRPKYIQVSAYDLNLTPIQGSAIFDADSISVSSNNSVYIPYLNTVTSSQSDLYNQFSSIRIDRGDDRYYPLGAGSYLICVSTTRNEPLEYEVVIVVEFPANQSFFELEDADASLAIQETGATPQIINSPVTVNTTISFPGAFTPAFCIIENGVTVAIDDIAEWLIGFVDTVIDFDDYKIVLDVGDDAYYDTIHDHSLSEWRNAWESSHQDTDPFPQVLVPLTNRP